MDNGCPLVPQSYQVQQMIVYWAIWVPYYITKQFYNNLGFIYMQLFIISETYSKKKKKKREALKWLIKPFF